MSKSRQPNIFTRFTTATSSALGRPVVFVVALSALLLWAASGPLLGFSDTWLLIINTSTTIITFLVVFIIQNTQNRDNLAMNIKLDAIMRKMGIIDGDMLSAEDHSDTDLENEKRHIEKSKERSKRHAKKR